MKSRPIIAVTGANGFLGCALVPLLEQSGFQVRAFTGHVRAEARPTEFLWRSIVRNAGAWIQHLPKSSANLTTAFNGVDTVIHLAGMSSVEQCEFQPSDSHEANVVLSEVVGIAARNARVRNFVFASSVVVYGENPDRAVHEADCLSPESLYARQKLEGERILSDISQDTGMSLRIGRFSHLFGEGQSIDKFIPRMLISAVNEHTLRIPVSHHGPQRDDLLYVGDLVHALVSWVGTQSDGKVEILNFGTGSSHTSEEIAEELLSLFDRRLGVERSMLSAYWSRSVDATKAQGRLGWKPTTEFGTALSKTLKWFRANQRNF